MARMRYKLLGHSGLRVSEIGLGTMTFGEEWGWGTPKAEARRTYEIFRAAGGNFIDTSDFYTAGTSERFLSEFIGADRDSVVLATKYAYGPSSKDPNAAGTHRKHLMQAIEASLRRLGTDRVDVFFVNGWDFLTPEYEVMRALDDVVRAGKALYIGISNAPAWIVSRCNTLAELRGWTPFIGLQVMYSLIERTAERDLLPMARALDLGILACSPLGEGALTGKYRVPGTKRGRLDDGSFISLNERVMAIADAVAKIAQEIGTTPAQVALAWVCDRGTIPLLGVRTPDQLLENLKSLELSLSEDHMLRLNQASVIDLGFPYNYLKETRCITFGGMYERIEQHRDTGIGVTTR